MASEDQSDVSGAMPGTDNIPGFAYLERVAAAAGRAVNANTRVVNDAWRDIAERKYNAGAAMHAWARIVSNSYGVVTEILRPPGAVPTPAWLVIPYSAKGANRFHGVRVDSVLEGEHLEATRFEPISGGTVVDKLVVDSPQVEGTRIEFELDEKAVKNLEVGKSYLGFIVRQGAGAAPPLVVVAVQVTP
jgi:hypothetical protein